jgi:ferredoxin
LVIHGADCSGCNVDPSPNLEDGLEGVNEILRVAGQAPIEVVPGGSSRRSGDEAGGSPISDGTERVTSRRGLLRTMIAGSLGVVIPSAREGPDTSDTTGSFVAFLEALGAIGNVNKEEREGRLAAYRLGVNARLCYGCKVCATLCPTGALHWEEDSGTRESARIRIDPSRCIGCGVCVDLCDVGAIDCKFSPELRVQQEISFMEERCSVCNRFFLASHMGEGLCPGCRRQEMDLRPDAARAAR